MPNSPKEKEFPEVVVVPPDVDPGALGAYLRGDGPMPMGAHGETYEEFSSRGRVEDCDCELIQCVCAQARLHGKDCRFRRALTCAVPIDCEEHGIEVCPTCDPCDCDKT